MEKGRKQMLKKVPTRKLLASIKRDLRRELQASESTGKRRKD